jgi:hypothetical protein
MEQPRGPGRVQTTGPSRSAVSTGGEVGEMGEEKLKGGRWCTCSPSGKLRGARQGPRADAR